MTLCQMFIQPEAAYSSVSELGETGAVQFRDVSLSDNKKSDKSVAVYLSSDKHNRFTVDTTCKQIFLCTMNCLLKTANVA